MNKCAVFFDIDGTLWDYVKEIPASTIDAIHKLQRAGHYAMICTGRTRSTVRDEKLLSIGFDGIVAGCGTHIEMDGQLLFERLLSYSELREMLAPLKQAGIGVFGEGTEKLYIDWEYFSGQQYAESFRYMGDDCVDLKSLHEKSRVNKLSTDFSGLSVEEMMACVDTTRYDVIVHDLGHIKEQQGSHVSEIIPKGFSKATGIEWICRHLGIAHENTYAFGDGSNDVEMLRYVAHGIAMGNGNDEAKAAADYVTTALHEDGIYQGLVAMGLIE